MSFMIEELVDDVRYLTEIQSGSHAPKNAFPRSRYGVISQSHGEGKRHVTFPVNPQERTRSLPFLVDVALNEPCGRSMVLDITYSVVIDRWIRGKKPPLSILLMLFA
jgi:hypothetical protein